MEVLHTLETAWMKGILARRRWHRWYHAIIAMNRYIIFKRVLETLVNSVTDPGCLSRILIFTHPGSRIQKQEQKRGVKIKLVVIPFL